MDENKTTNEVDEAVAEVDTNPMSTDELKEAVDKTLSKVRNDAMLVGYKVAAQTVLQIIAPWRKPKCSHREYERIFKQLEKFFGEALNYKEEATVEEHTAETVQN